MKNAVVVDERPFVSWNPLVPLSVRGPSSHLLALERHTVQRPKLEYTTYATH